MSAQLAAAHATVQGQADQLAVAHGALEARVAAALSAVDGELAGLREQLCQARELDPTLTLSLSV